ncbi:DUF3899 domain-containing protein [Bacillus sp. S/N-304-OC-R1]|uniref:DUF3899 domain-containing protein n=1 Tax=Bacillus sp. S/N-304-OC-R1 TaxID=2758034 RepID=UPI001C8EDD5C|nr:DUF3899 domain-containing protein [Bacillus sp. S/N-304-OC-R1]MBY0124339.1 DUF3899 domain-containing protein [Bacillus sp. S/N-304-OC-R1]
MKKTVRLIFISLTISFIGALLSGNGIWEGFINTLFFVSLLFLMLGGSLLVLRGGMFEGILYSFRRFYRNTSKLENYISEQADDMKKPPINNSLKEFSMGPIIFSGAALFFFTLIASLI